MSLLTIVQNACNRIGIAPPTAVVSSTDTQILQLLALANEEGEELSTGASAGLSYDWQALQTETTFVTTATESQGAIATIAPGFKYIIDGTIWDRTKRLPVYGSLDPQTWQNFKSWGVTSPFPKYRVRGGLLLLMPIPADGDSYYFEYQTQYWATSANGSTLKSAFTADDDVSLLDEQILTAGLIWRWKAAKGFEYAEDFRKYQVRVTGAIARDTERPVLHMGRRTDARTGIVIPIGSWNA
jgi:hypothetical protein